MLFSGTGPYIRLGRTPHSLCFHHWYWRSNSSCHSCLGATVSSFIQNHVPRKSRYPLCSQGICTYSNQPSRKHGAVSHVYITTQSTEAVWILDIGERKGNWIELVFKGSKGNSELSANQLRLPLYNINKCKEMLSRTQLCQNQDDGHNKEKGKHVEWQRKLCNDTVHGRSVLTFQITNPADAEDVTLTFCLHPPSQLTGKVPLFIDLFTQTFHGFAGRGYTKIESYIRTELKFSGDKFCFLVPTTGKIHYAKVQWYHRQQNNFSFQIQWYQHNDSQSVEIQDCSNNCNLTEYFCHNYTLLPPSGRKRQSHVVFLVPKILDMFCLTALWSWKTASESCESLGGYLPVLRDKDELNEFASIVRLSAAKFPVEIIALGLFIRDISQVFCLVFISALDSANECQLRTETDEPLTC